MKIQRILVSAFVYPKPTMPALEKGYIWSQLRKLAENTLEVNTEAEHVWQELVTENGKDGCISSILDRFQTEYKGNPLSGNKNYGDKLTLVGESHILKLYCQPIETALTEGEEMAVTRQEEG